MIKVPRHPGRRPPRFAVREMLTTTAQLDVTGVSHPKLVEMWMPKNIVDQTAKRLPISSSASLGSSANQVTCLGQLIGYTLRAVECEFILLTLRHHQGNRTHAANALGISVRSLRDKIRVYREQGENVPAPQSSHGGDPLHGTTRGILSLIAVDREL